MPFKNIMYGRWYRRGYNHFHGYKFEVSRQSCWCPLGLENLNRCLRFSHERFPFIYTCLRRPSQKKSHILTDPEVSEQADEYHQIVKRTRFGNKARLMTEVLAVCAVVPSCWNHKCVSTDTPHLWSEKVVWM